jgi:hypothetical protein
MKIILVDDGMKVVLVEKHVANYTDLLQIHEELLSK